MLLDQLNSDYPDDWSLRSSIKRKRQIDTITGMPQYAFKTSVGIIPSTPNIVPAHLRH